MGRQEMGRYLSESVLFDRQVVAFPKLKVECVDLELMVERHREEVDEMKALFGYHYPEGTVIESKDGGPTMLPTLKYTKDLFYIAPLLHKELPQDLEKLIMLDIDLEFKTDIVDLYRHFNEANNGTPVGSPGRYQGFNTGVALYHL